RFHKVIEEEQRTPSDAKAMKDELAEMDLSNAALKKELEGRMKFVANLKSENFYLSIDTKTQRLRFHYGDAILREVPVTIGESKTSKSADNSCTALPLQGALPSQAKCV